MNTGQCTRMNNTLNNSTLTTRPSNTLNINHKQEPNNYMDDSRNQPLNTRPMKVIVTLTLTLTVIVIVMVAATETVSVH